MSVMLAGCASEPVVRQPGPDSMFSDQLFAAPSERISAEDLFAMSPEMRQYLAVELVPGPEQDDVRNMLYQKLYAEGQLKLEYDATMTRNAAQAFAAKSGNCLSLVVLTAAFAKELGVPVRFQTVYLDEDWSRRDGIEFFTTHVNVTLGVQAGIEKGGGQGTDLTIDFLPPKDFGHHRTRRLAENTVVAMYMNNRAAESLREKPLDRAYWWARAAISQDPGYMPGYNTLGIVYKLHGNLREAQRVFERILELEPENAIAMGNLVMVFNELGMTAQAEALAGRLKAIRPHSPFFYFDQGMEAMNQQDFVAARDLFARQIQRDDSNSQAHFWLGRAYEQLGETKNAAKEISIAIDTSTMGADRKLYVAELARLNAAARRGAVPSRALPAVR